MHASLLGRCVRILIALASMAALYSQPTVTSCTANYTTSTSTQIACTISTTGQHGYVKYGTATTSYTNRSKSRPQVSAAGDPSTQLRMALGGLTPSTTYYVSACARPNADNLTNEGCSSEFTFATSAEPTVNPPFPAAPVEYAPTEPSIGTYTVVLMKRCSSGYPCADGAVGPHANEDSLQTVLNNATYGTVIRFPRALDVNVQMASNAGYDLPAKSVQGGKTGIDDPTHDWIILEGAGCSDTAHFPQFGARIDSTFSGKLPIFRTTAMASQNRGQHFQVENAASHHYWLRCLALEYPAGAAADVVNPNAYRHAIMIQKSGGSHIANQRYFVLDRLYVPGTGGTKRLVYGIYSGAENTAVIGCDVRVGIWRHYAIPSGSPSVGGSGNRTLTVPASTFQIRSTDSARGVPSGASVVVTSAGLAGNFVFTLGTAGGRFYYDTRSISSINCTSCTGVGAAADPTGTTPNTEYTYIFGSVDTAGAITVTNTVNQNYQYTPICDTGSATCQYSFGFEVGQYDPGSLIFSNNYIEGAGLGFYADAWYGAQSFDTTGTARRNWFNIPRSYHYNNAATDGYKYQMRQHFEMKRGRNWLISGNLFTGAFSYQNISPSIFLSGRGVYTTDLGNGISDIWVRSNTIAHAPSGWECSGNIYASADGIVPQYILFENNLVYDINRFLYDNGGPGALNNAYFTSIPGCQGVRMRNNTFGRQKGLAPVVGFFGGDDVRGGRFEMRDNLLYYNQGDSSCTRHGVNTDETANNSTYPRLPALSGSTATAKFDSFFAKIGSGSTTANNSITNNLMVGGWCTSDSSTTTDLSSATVTSVSTDFPSGQNWPSGTTMALRETAAGITDAAASNYLLAAGSTYARASADKFSPIGANLTELLNDQGVVRDIAITAGATHAAARYTAPDSRACRFDVSVDSGATWTGFSDGGGGQRRTAIATSLTASTAYTWRVICYYLQSNDGRQWDDWASDRLTQGSFSTASSAGGARTVTYTLPSGIGASKYRVTFYLADTTTSTQTCTASPCSVTFPSTTVRWRPDVLSAADVVLVVGDWVRF